MAVIEIGKKVKIIKGRKAGKIGEIVETNVDNKDYLIKIKIGEKYKKINIRHVEPV